MNRGLYITILLLGFLSVSICRGQSKDEQGEAGQGQSAEVEGSVTGGQAGEPAAKDVPGDAGPPASWSFYLGVVLVCLVLSILQHTFGWPADSETEEPVAAATAPPASIPEDNSDGVTDEAIHDFVLAVALETNRLEDKLQKLGDDQKPKKAMGRIVRRLERKLNEMGYEMGSLLGKAYRDGMTCYPEFISSDDPAHTEPVITRVLLPQVFHLGKLIQVPKIQVSVHYGTVTNE